ncbi:branched-chain amino acid ABC transporter permease [Limnochorda pilosa]|uniref:ABC transporter permease n=1 Tax=Limnochorda pilosa TaxID=1555112 RepID=A0A0K2SNF8_LIMPI|nr:branched-chain amino acid ABC transporter permease [Limnochorda pilosa]BAS28547.1 ABC transporter permease [Limnochorda pilosa]
MQFLAQQIVNALQLGSIYALIALGYTLVYGVLRLINFAHGDIFMVGAFLAFFAAVLLDLPFVPTLLLSMAATALLGVLIERFAYRPLRNAPRVSAVITALGVGLFLEHFTLASVGAQPRHLPPLIETVVYRLGPVRVTTVHLVIFIVAVVLMVVLDRIVNRSLTGMAMRAVSWDKSVVPLMGVSVDRIIALTFAIGSGLAAAGGLLYATAYPVIEPYMGVLVGWKAFVAAVVGGIGVIRGAMLGAYLLGMVEILVAAYLPSTYRDFIAFGLLLILLVFRPQGILGRREVQKV